HFKLPAAAEEHLPLRAIELGAAVAIVRIVRAPQPLLINEHPLAPRLAIARILERYLLCIGELAVVVGDDLAAEARDLCRMRVHTEPPAGVVEVVDAVVAHVARAVSGPGVPTVVAAVGL